jgi:hypothetical protein
LTEQLDRGAISEAAAVQQMRPPSFYMLMREVLFLLHRPQVILPLLVRFKLPGESEEDAAARWRRVAKDIQITRQQALQLRPSYLEYQEQLRRLSSQTEASLGTLAAVRQAGPPHKQYCHGSVQRCALLRSAMLHSTPLTSLATPCSCNCRV